MKKTLIMLTSVLSLSTMLMTTANAAEKPPTFMVIYGEKQIDGENISFVKSGKWVKASPLISEWVDVGSPTGCSEWTPAVNTVATGITFEQTSSNCIQNQTRTVQTREQNDYTFDYRNIGNAVTENQTINNKTLSRTATGTKSVNPCGSTDINNYRWVNGTPNMRMMYIIWDGVKVFPDIGDITLTEYTYGGYKYTKQSQTADWGYYTFSYVCRTPI